MATSSHLFRTAAEIEDTAGVDRIDELLAQRHAIVQEVAPLRALYGGNGIANHRLKVELSRIQARLYAEAQARNEKKPSDDYVDRLAHADDGYAAMVELMTTQAARWVELEEALEAIDMRVNRGQALLRYASSEPKQ